MITNVLQIPSNDWGLSLDGPGAVVTGEDDIKQCIKVILFTRKGSDPLRPLFGSDLYKWIDKPVNIAGPNIVIEVIEAIGIWEKRAHVENVVYALGDNGQLTFTITLTIVATKSALVIEYPNDFTYTDTQAFGTMFNTGFF